MKNDWYDDDTEKNADDDLAGDDVGMMMMIQRGMPMMT